MEEKRQKLVWIIFMVFLAIIFEGVLRKWIFPSYQKYFFFVRDPFVILAYVYALHANIPPKRGLLMYLIAAFTFVVTVFAFFQTLYSHLPWWIIAYSWRTHFLMLPFALLIGSYINKEDLKKLFRFTLRLTPIYTVIAYFQSVRPISHWINAGLLGMFTPLRAEEGLIRTEGFFTSSVGNALFVGMLVAILLLTWVKENWSDIVGLREKIVYTFCSCVILALSGQRTTFLLVGLVIASGLVLSTVVGRNMLIRYMKPSVSFIVICTLLLVYVFPQHLASISRRFSTRSSTGVAGLDIVERTIGDLTSFYKMFVDKIPLMGLGLGYSSNAANVYNLSVIEVFSENEWGRHIIELGPIVGFLVIVFRVFISIYLLLLSSVTFLKNNDPAPFLFYSILLPYLLFGQLTGNGIASGFVWFLTGIVLALLSKNPNESA